MKKYKQAPTAILNPAAGSYLAEQNQTTSVKTGDVSVYADIQHFSLILYSLPAERARAVVPHPLKIEESSKNGGRVAWLSVASFLDQGAMPGSHGSFEQTSYRLHVMHDGVPANWNLGLSIGSLSAVATRNLWPMPWHLGAMEFNVAYDFTEGRYRGYRLQTQSQWANATWEIIDSGKSLLENDIKHISFPSSLSANTFNNYFTRRDRSLGSYKVRYHELAMTSGKLRVAQSDLLERLGLLTREELMRPTLVAVQRKASCQIFSPTILGMKQSESRGYENRHTRLALAS